jgi:hypothetical protein
MVLATEMSGKQPGRPGFLGALQDATTALLDDLSPDDLEEYAQAAKDWSKESPPPHIQSRCVGLYVPIDPAIPYSFTHRMAASMRKRIIQDFQRQLFKTCGIRSLVLTAYEGEDHDLNICL